MSEQQKGAKVDRGLASLPIRILHRHPDHQNRIRTDLVVEEVVVEEYPILLADKILGFLPKDRPITETSTTTAHSPSKTQSITSLEEIPNELMMAKVFQTPRAAQATRTPSQTRTITPTNFSYAPLDPSPSRTITPGGTPYPYPPFNISPSRTVTPGGTPYPYPPSDISPSRTVTPGGSFYPSRDERSPVGPLTFEQVFKIPHILPGSVPHPVTLSSHRAVSEPPLPKLPTEGPLARPTVATKPKPKHGAPKAQAAVQPKIKLIVKPELNPRGSNTPTLKTGPKPEGLPGSQSQVQTRSKTALNPGETFQSLTPATPVRCCGPLSGNTTKKKNSQSGPPKLVIYDPRYTARVDKVTRPTLILRHRVSIESIREVLAWCKKSAEEGSISGLGGWLIRFRDPTRVQGIMEVCIMFGLERMRKECVDLIARMDRYDCKLNLGTPRPSGQEAILNGQRIGWRTTNVPSPGGEWGLIPEISSRRDPTPCHDNSGRVRKGNYTYDWLSVTDFTRAPAGDLIIEDMD